MKKSLALLVSVLFVSQAFAGSIQSADLHLSIDVKNHQASVIQMYTYLDTQPEIFEGKNVFEAITFRGNGLTLKLNGEQTKLVAHFDNKDLILSDISFNDGQLDVDGYKSIVVEDAAKIQLVEASLGQKIKIKVSSCLPGMGFCSTRTVKVKPHQYKFEVTGIEGDVLCIKRGFNTTPENYGKNPDKYSLGNCN